VRPPQPLPSSLAGRARLPLAETRYRAGEILVEIPYATPQAQIADVLRRHRLVEAEAVDVDLLGLSLRRWRIADARTAASVVSELAGETALTRVQPNYLFAPADEAGAVAAAQPAALSAPVEASLAIAQYALVKMKVAPSLEAADAAPIRVAVIDTAIDETHPDLAGAVDQRFDAIGDGSAVASKDHGTAMAGGIAANGRLHGVARHVKILSARAFDADGAGNALGTTLSIVKGLDWSVKRNAEIVNMSFAGPDDPTLRDALAAADGRGVVLIGAAGNAGPAAPPQYPGADGHVIAATATDADDKLYSGANVGPYVAISAPGVDVLLPASGGGYAMETGTSVSSALIAGVVALMLERKPDLRPGEVRQRLTATAVPLGGPSHAREFGAGLVDAEKAVLR
jgi:subtilisin family serine protease